jgi:hypothetical protein
MVVNVSDEWEAVDISSRVGNHFLWLVHGLIWSVWTIWSAQNKCSRSVANISQYSFNNNIYLIKRRGRVLTLLLRIRELQGSNLGPEPGYPKVFRGLPQSFQANAGVVP